MSTFLELQTHVLRNLGNRKTDVDILTLVKAWINACYLDLVTTGKFPELQKFAPLPDPALDGKDTFNTSATAESYAYPAGALTIFTLRDTTNDRPIKSRDMRWYERNHTATLGKPLLYATYGGRIYLEPNADDVYVIRRLYRKKVTLTTLALDADVPVISDIWHEALELGATLRGFRSLRDFSSYGQFKADLKDYIVSHSEQYTEEEEDFDAGIQVRM
jgi:hypothetical protein